MNELLILALLALFIGLAARFDPLVYFFYVLVGIYLVNRFWLQRSRQALTAQRTLSSSAGERLPGASDTSAFLGDRVEVTLEIINRGMWPIAWLIATERLPTALRPVEPARWTLTLGPRERQLRRYTLHCVRRGYYPIGPLLASTGTPWVAERHEAALTPVTYFTVYPHIVPLDQLGLPSRLPLGSRRSPDPLLPDPSRVIGIRDYTPGDRLRDVHWRATAQVGSLQVKQYQPSQPLQVELFLDLDAGAYDFRTRDRASELAIVTAASLATYIVNLRQSVGLATNGRDPLAQHRPADATVPLPVVTEPEVGPEAAAAAAIEPPPAGVSMLPATDRLIATTSQLPAPPPRRVIATDPFAPPTLPEQTYDEAGSVFFDGPSVSQPPASPVLVPIREGRGHLANLLTVLARIALRERPAEDGTASVPVPLPFDRLIRRRAAGLPWGTTVILITSAPDEHLAPTLVFLRNSGFSPLVIAVQPDHRYRSLPVTALRAAGWPAFEVRDEGRLAELPLMAPAH